MLLAPGARAAITWHVSPGSTGACTVADPNCATIQAAVNAAVTSSDTIQVAAGTYAEHVIIGKNITINGAGAAQTIVDGTQSGTVFTINLGTVNLSGMTVTNGKITTDFGGGINVNSGTVNITSSTVSNNSAISNGGGINDSNSNDSNSGTVSLRSSIVAGNISPTDPDLTGALTSQGYNLVGTSDAAPTASPTE